MSPMISLFLAIPSGLSFLGNEGMILEVGAKTDVGRIRSNNEDALYIDQQKGLFVIADGLGGHVAGEVASKIAVEEIRKFIDEQARNNFTLEILREAGNHANQMIYMAAIEDPSLHAMGTTVLMAMIKDTNLSIAHVGDSRAYALTNTGLKRLTDDHTVTYQLIKDGIIKEEEALLHTRRGALLRVLGLETTVEVDAQQINYQGETLLLCTDGLTDMLRDKEIEEILLATPGPQEACDLLVDRANEHGGRDNISVIVVRKK